MKGHPAITRLRAGYTVGPYHTLECKQALRARMQFASFGRCSYHRTDMHVRKEARGNVKEADLARWILITDSLKPHMTWSSMWQRRCSSYKSSSSAKMSKK